VAALLFTSLGTIGREQGTGYRIAAFSSCALCLLGALILSRYNEKRVMGILGEPVKK
jgi:GPH family glycoside/pentoside/hexuronide:cation symporter